MSEPTLNLRRWNEHFRNNQRDRQEPDWNAPITMNASLIRRIRPSIAQFELGDGGGPAYLIAWNRETFLRDPGARELVDLWFKEESEHSRLLGDLLNRLGGKSIEEHWSFSVFCSVRKVMGVSFELRALLLTEIVSNVYYKMLFRHGGLADPALAQVCRLIIRDETGHIAFHKDRLQRTGKRFGPVWSAVFRLMGLAAGTMLWVNHRPAVVALGGTTQEFYREIFEDMSGFIQGIRKSAGEPLYASQIQLQD